MEFKAGQNFLKLGADVSVIGMFIGNPNEYRSHWDRKTERGTACTGDGCPICATGAEPGFKFKIDFAEYKNGGTQIKTWEAGWRAYVALKSAHDMYNLDKTPVKITQIGAGSTVEFEILPEPLDPSLFIKSTKKTPDDLPF